jgi:siroheme synthase (precorrin-2 oxidase/ferrochelatase)
LQGAVRELLKERIPDQNERQQILWGILFDEKVWEHLKTSYNMAYEEALRHLPNREAL